MTHIGSQSFSDAIITSIFECLWLNNKDKISSSESPLLQTGAVYEVAVESLLTSQQYCCGASLKHTR